MPSRPSSFDLARLRDGIKPYRLHWYPTLRSTNDHAAGLRERGVLFAPAVVLTGRQTAGRGRGTHRWWSGGGGLTVTFVLPTDDAVEPHQVPLLAGLAVRRAAAGLLGVDVQLKWPNDLLHDGRKLAGLLCERVRKVDLVGVGLNVNVDPADAPTDLQSRVTSLRHIAGRPFDMTDVVIALAAELRAVMRERAEKSFAVMLREYNAHHSLAGKRVTVIEPGEAAAISGTCEGLDDMGRLLVRDRREIHRLTGGQVVAR